MKNGNRKLAAGRRHFGGGLYLQVGESGSASWLLRFQRGIKANGKPAEHWLGLGPRSVFSLKEAKQRARAVQQQIYNDIDPLEAKREQRRLKAMEDARRITFADAAQQYYALHETNWSSQKHRQAFINSLKQHAFPVIGTWPVAAVDIAAVLKIVEPIWIKKNMTASRVLGRIETILDWATVHKFRTGANPARWKDHLDEVLPSGGEIGKVVEHPALDYHEVPSFVQKLSQHQGIGPKALEFVVLTASRTGEVTKARWSEIDYENRIWTRPKEHMKSRKEHRVPLTGRMIKLLKSLHPEGGADSLIFVGTKLNRPLGKMTLPKIIDGMKYDNITVHGFRASFKTWATEQTAYPDSLIEFCLAHAVGNDTERAYQRSDMVEKRRQLMEAWSTFVGSPQRKTGTVTPIRKAGV